MKNLHAWVWPGNIEYLLEAGRVPKDLDLLAIDIDSNDYWVWKVIHNDLTATSAADALKRSWLAALRNERPAQL